ncbi:heparinase II/III family protein [Nonomuraea rhodomycinica]|uniref:Heparinase II/III family protein n=1 Tax=Nonomuraea rhodomycinica TaxID=1712872 RepID=A0A7Y6IKL0_9ACTN|nr:heparinase II/III family protein [Nonomuraea rhodomycinica]NUW39458.1 heparinase II/III family protein [Nonomuraea rhodomycinica]
MVPDVTARSLWDAVPAEARDAVLAAAAGELARPAPHLSAGDWARTFRDGARTVHEDKVRRLRERVDVLALAAVLTGEVAAATAPPGACPHLDAAVDGLMTLAEASTWCWAPHDRGAAARGEVVPDPDDPFLDLGAAEIAALFAWADHALGPHLDTRAPGLRRRLRREVDRRVLTPFEQVRDWHWIGRDGGANNWNPWIHGAVLAAALLLCDDARRRERVVRLVAEGLDHYLACLPDDGGIDEGIAYWWQGACRLLEALDLLGAAGPPVLPALLAYPQRMHLGADWYVNTGDAPARLAGERPWHVLFRWGERLGRPATVAYAVSAARESGGAVQPRAGLGRAMAALADRRWCRAVAAAGTASAAPWLARECWLPRIQVMVARETAGSADGLTVAAKAGHNGEHHNHLDVGSYWVALDGRPMVVDVGQPTYTAATFGPHRYEEWPFQSAWHNVPEPGRGQLPGAGYRACDVAVRFEESSAVLRADLSAAYPAGLLTRWERAVRLVRAGAQPYVTVEDEWAGCPEPVLFRHVLAGEVECGAGRAVVMAAGGRWLELRWDPAVATASIEHRDIDDPRLARSWGARLTRLTLAVTGPVSGGRFAVSFRRYSGNDS